MFGWLVIVPTVPIVSMGTYMYRLVCDGHHTMAACGGLLALVYRQIHPGLRGSGHVWGPVIHHIPSLVPTVPIVPIGTRRLQCVVAPTVAACGGLLGSVYRQIYPGFYGSSYV